MKSDFPAITDNYLFSLLFSGRKTNLLPDPGYVALTNICLEDGGCPVKKDLPGHSSKKSCQNPIKKCRQNSPAAMFSCLDINTKKRLILLCSSESSGVQCATLEVVRKIPKYRALHVTDCNSVFVAELLEIQIETINVNEERDPCNNIKTSHIISGVF